MPLRGPGGGGGEWVPLFIAKDPSEPLIMSVNLIEPTPRRGSRFDTDELLRCGYYSSNSASSDSDLSSPRSSMSGSSRADSPVHRRASQMDLEHLAPTMIPIRMAPSPPPLEEGEGRSSGRAARHSPALEAVAGFVSVTMQRTASATASALGQGCTGQAHVRRRSSLSHQQDKLHSLVDFAPGAGDAEAERRRRAKMVMAGGEQAAALEEEDERYAAMLKLFGALVVCGLLIPVAGQWLV